MELNHLFVTQMFHRSLRTSTLWVVRLTTPAQKVYILLVLALLNALLVKPGLRSLDCAQVSNHN